MQRNPSEWRPIPGILLGTLAVILGSNREMVNSNAVQGGERKVVVIGVDGVRPDAMAFADTPHIDALISNGAYSPNAQGEDLTFSGPNWATILHGVHRDKHGVVTNDIGTGPFGSYTGNNFAEYPDWFTILEAFDPALSTAKYTGWSGIASQPTGADIDVYHQAGSYLTGLGDAMNTNAAAQLIATQDPDVVFLYLHDPDSAGHAVSWDSWLDGPTKTDYITSIEDVDSQVGQVMAAVASRPNVANEDWLAVFVSDHGGRGRGHEYNTPDRRTVPFVVSGDLSVQGTPFPNARNVDVAKTVLTYMGVPEAMMAALDGHVVGLSPSSPPVGLNVNLIFNGDAEYDRGVTDTDFDHAVSGWDDPGDGHYSPTVNILQHGYDYWSNMAIPAGTAAGQNVFHGGEKAESSMSQWLDVAAMAAAIDFGGLSYRFSALLGGLPTENDSARAAVRFVDEHASQLGIANLAPAFASEGGFTTPFLLQRESEGAVPVGTRTVEVQLVFNRTDGQKNDGFADNLSFMISPSEPATLGDVNLDGSVNGLDVDPFVGKVVNGIWQAEADVNEDGNVNGLDVGPFLAAVITGGAAVVPEPSTFALTILSLFALVTSTWRRRNHTA